MFLIKDAYVEVHGVDPEKWAKKHGIDLTNTVSECYRCKRPRKPTIPIVQGKTYGMISAPCECGHDSAAPYVMRIDNGDLSPDLDALARAKRIRKRRKMDAYNKKRRDARRAAKEAKGARSN